LVGHHGLVYSILRVVAECNRRHEYLSGCYTPYRAIAPILLQIYQTPQKLLIMYTFKSIIAFTAILLALQPASCSPSSPIRRQDNNLSLDVSCSPLKLDGSLLSADLCWNSDNVAASVSDYNIDLNTCLTNENGKLTWKWGWVY
jgi:hypothetical protein